MGKWQGHLTKLDTFKLLVLYLIKDRTVVIRQQTCYTWNINQRSDWVEEKKLFSGCFSNFCVLTDTMDVCLTQFDYIACSVLLGVVGAANTRSTVAAPLLSCFSFAETMSLSLRLTLVFMRHCRVFFFFSFPAATKLYCWAASFKRSAPDIRHVFHVEQRRAVVTWLQFAPSDWWRPLVVNGNAEAFRAPLTLFGRSKTSRSSHQTRQRHGYI